jgi:hypothetical protein
MRQEAGNCVHLLHASALSDDFYTASLYDITAYDSSSKHGVIVRDDVHFEQMSVGVREVRGWLRGRYSHNIPAPTIDNILKLLSQLLGQGDVLTAGEFFSVLRLVVHVASRPLQCD